MSNLDPIEKLYAAQDELREEINDRARRLMWLHRIIGYLLGGTEQEQKTGRREYEQYFGVPFPDNREQPHD